MEGLSLFVSITSLTHFILRYKISQNHRLYHKNPLAEKSETKCAYDQLIGNTPLIRLNRLSSLCKRNIFLKMENSNPGGTSKDRAAKYILDMAEKEGFLRPGMNVIEGTSGSTGISLAYQCKSRGYQLHVVMPDDQAEEKRVLLEKLGAIVHIVPTSSIANNNHYVKRAMQLAKELDGFFVNQFENLHNADIHYQSTGPELWQQMSGDIDGVVMSAGTGGTIAGISKFLKEQDPSITTILADPYGSSLFNKVRYNVCYTNQQSEKTIRKHRYDSIVEGVGLDRVTQNFNEAMIDTAYQIEDQNLIYVAHWMLRNEGLLIGSSTALNLTAVLTSLEHFDEGSRIVTICCDQGNRHFSRFWNAEYLRNYQLTYPESEEEINEGMKRILSQNNELTRSN